MLAPGWVSIYNPTGSIHAKITGLPGDVHRHPGCIHRLHLHPTGSTGRSIDSHRSSPPQPSEHPSCPIRAAWISQ
jgi:hypothetical protein